MHRFGVKDEKKIYLETDDLMEAVEKYKELSKLGGYLILEIIEYDECDTYHTIYCQ